MKTKKTLDQKAPIIASGVAFFLALIKLTVGIISGSVALLSSAIDSILDMGVSIFNTFAIKYASEEADREHQFGHGKMEGIAAALEGIIITLSGFYILYESVRKIINPEEILHINWTIFVMIISIIATGGLIYFLNYVYKKTNNLVIKGDATHYKMDLFTNLGVILSLIIIFFVPSLVWIDGIIGFIIGLYIIKEAWGLIQDGLNLLLDKALEEHDEVNKIIKKYVSDKKIDSYHCLRTRAGGSKDKFVEFHFVMDPKTTILVAHNLGDEIENEIKKLDKKACWHIVWHSDPYDDSEGNGCN